MTLCLNHKCAFGRKKNKLSLLFLSRPEHVQLISATCKSPGPVEICQEVCPFKAPGLDLEDGNVPQTMLHRMAGDLLIQTERPT